MLLRICDESRVSVRLIRLVGIEFIMGLGLR